MSDKKTLLWLTTLADETGEQVLKAWEGKSPASGKEQGEAKIAAIRNAMLSAGADREAQDRMSTHVAEAESALDELGLTEDASEWFRGLARHVVSRSH